MIFGPSLTLNVTFTSFGPPATGVTLWLTSALVKPFSAIIARSTVFDAPDHALVEERVEPQLDAALAQLLVDLGAVDLLAALVVDDLDPLALLHVVGHDHADGAVREREVVELDRQVLEEVGAPTAP